MIGRNKGKEKWKDSEILEANRKSRKQMEKAQKRKQKKIRENE